MGISNVVVPANKIAIFRNPEVNIDNERISNLVKRHSHKRDWFTQHFYKCLPLAIGNTYGFSIFSEWDFSVNWNGESNINAVTFEIFEKEEIVNSKYPEILSHFGEGTFTVSLPFYFRTPKNVNLMTMNSPNTIIPNITVMTGVVETDNLRRNFTLNLKCQMPNIKTFIPAGTPLAIILPIPRYFQDNFELVFAEDIFSKDIVLEEENAALDAFNKRMNIEKKSAKKVGMDYYKGYDVYGNKFFDHQTLTTPKTKI